MNLKPPTFYKILLLLSLIFTSFITQKTVTLVIDSHFYSCSSNYRTLYDLSRNSPFPFSSFQMQDRIQNMIIHEGITIYMRNDLNVP